ncbi:hypothetical protein SESBI_17517 [Sesbania bispinosa]|nr:hypothetical protein SESBI_17517 [Sesbania bispinosa]
MLDSSPAKLTTNQKEKEELRKQLTVKGKGSFTRQWRQWRVRSGVHELRLPVSMAKKQRNRVAKAR